MTTVTVINRGTILTDAQAAVMTAALQVQVHRDLAPAWDVTAELVFAGANDTPDPTSWWLLLLDNSDQADALGYHEMTSAGGPIGKAFLATTILDGGLPSVVVSHELLEMLVDPWIDRCVAWERSDTAGTLYALEVCDACEDDQWAYDINGVTVSDFVYPAWFQGWRQSRSTKFDHRDEMVQPFELLAGGYIGTMDFRGGGWRQITADRVHRRQFRAHVGQRRERRHLPRDFWRPSEPKKLDFIAPDAARRELGLPLPPGYSGLATSQVRGA